MKKKKTDKSKEAESPTLKGGPYRNIEESKKHQVSGFPDVKKVPFKPADHDFIICACDGIWDCYSNEQAIKFIRQRRERGPKNAGISPSKGKS